MALLELIFWVLESLLLILFLSITLLFPTPRERLFLNFLLKVWLKLRNSMTLLWLRRLLEADPFLPWGTIDSAFRFDLALDIVFDFRRILLYNSRSVKSTFYLKKKNQKATFFIRLISHMHLILGLPVLRDLVWKKMRFFLRKVLVLAQIHRFEVWIVTSTPSMSILAFGLLPIQNSVLSWI